MAAELSRQRQRALFLALLASLLLWNLPFGGLAMYPFKLFATWLHELSHGLVMLVTGAGFEHLDIYRDTSGLAQATRSVTNAGRAAIASAGYLGTSIAGAGFLIIGQTRRGARSVLIFLGALLALSALLWIRNDFGITAVLVGAAACVGLAVIGGERLSIFVVNFIAAQACIHAILDIRVLFRSQMVINGEVVGASDAHNMASATFGNHWFWASVWIAMSALVFYLALRRIHDHQRQPARASLARAVRRVTGRGEAKAVRKPE